MCGALGRVVAVGAEVALVLGRVARDDVALHAGDAELVDLPDFGRDAAHEARLGLGDEVRVVDDIVPAPLVGVVLHRDGLAVDFAHEARLGAPVGFIEADELRAELRLEYVGQDEDRRLHLEAGEAGGWRQGVEICKQRGDVAAVGGERDHPHDAQGGVDNVPEPVERQLALALGHVGGKRAEEPRDAAVEVPEEAVSRIAVGDALLTLVGGIDADAEEREFMVIEEVAAPADGLDCRARVRVGGGTEEAQHDIAAGGGIEGVARIGEGALLEPRGGIAGGEAGTRRHGAGFRSG